VVIHGSKTDSIGSVKDDPNMILNTPISSLASISIFSSDFCFIS